MPSIYYHFTLILTNWGACPTCAYTKFLICLWNALGNANEKGEVVVLPKIETTFSADAKLKGTIDITYTGTYLSIIRPGGIHTQLTNCSGYSLLIR